MKQESQTLDLFVGAFHAKDLALQGSEKARQMTVTSGLNFLGLYKKSGPVGLLVKMLLGSSTWASTQCWLTWKVKITPSKHLLFQLAPSTPHTDEIGCGLLHTPTKTANQQSMKSGYLMPTPTQDAANRTKKYQQGGTPLSMAATMWPTPKARDWKDGRSEGLGTRHSPNLGQVVGQSQATGALNPTWVEWLMGFPEGWTDLDNSVMPSCRKSQKS